ncbi:barstar family protein [Rhodanobacter sp. PCA2]|uniref:barstar family protein n=1 Tax=Rhodanobacter sp. PCA2 TaxID=2006117 RepID=UPI0015E6FED9|nr:barstar family protein [Rhodanobacter sp. PCA2]MBA2078656.1 barnase inhibitor [Rhodanobacter sp. PCA2]
MSTRDASLDLSRPAHNGVYFVDGADLDTMANAAAREELGVCRVDLAACRDKADLLDRMAAALPLPADFGGNWDALADCLRDPSWRPADGHALLFAHADALRQADAASFDILLGILDDAATFATEQDRPFFAFLALPDDEQPDHA